jgi:hypothetical protein
VRVLHGREEYYDWEIKSNSGSEGDDRGNDTDSENGSNVEVGDGEDRDAEGEMEAPTGTGTTAVSTWGAQLPNGTRGCCHHMARGRLCPCTVRYLRPLLAILIQVILPTLTYLCDFHQLHWGRFFITRPSTILVMYIVQIILLVINCKRLSFLTRFPFEYIQPTTVKLTHKCNHTHSAHHTLAFNTLTLAFNTLTLELSVSRCYFTQSFTLIFGE